MAKKRRKASRNPPKPKGRPGDVTVVIPANHVIRIAKTLREPGDKDKSDAQVIQESVMKTLVNHVTGVEGNAAAEKAAKDLKGLIPLE